MIFTQEHLYTEYKKHTKSFVALFDKENGFIKQCKRNFKPLESNLQSFVCRIEDTSGYVVYGHNSLKSHPMQKRFATNDHKIFMHAEIHAIVNGLCGKVNLTNSTLRIYRWNKQNQPSLSFPCDGCMRAIMAYGIKEVRFFDQDGSHKKLKCY